jgi:hypothetical protein
VTAGIFGLIVNTSILEIVSWAGGKYTVMGVPFEG